ncbi:MAG: septal ring lytic transglycosylase RlpA family protein [Proteobacteria bacterium]|nr:septal ring lytic transglycosylase RlpA family protein [Pseudomonadota bacterium]
MPTAPNELRAWAIEQGERLRRNGRSLAVLALAGVSLAACATPQGPATVAHVTPRAGGGHAGAGVPGTMRPYQVNGVWYTPRDQPGYEVVGVASWYGAQFHNRRTADGELFDMDAPSAAHKTLPLPCIVEVTNLENGRKLQVRVNDRGPFVDGRVIDLSREAAKRLGFYAKGTARVRVRYVGPAGLARPEDGLRYASAAPAPRQTTQTPQTPQAAQTSATARTPQADPPARDRDDDIGKGLAELRAPPPSYAMDEEPPASAGSVEHMTAEAAPVRPAAAPVRSVRVQAAAFSDRGNAERAAARLAGEGETSIDTIQRGDAVLYRVTVRCAGDGSAVDRVAAAGFPGARLLDGF